MNARVVICIPAFNEAKSIGEVIAKAKPYAAEIIVCDDGSVDGTAEVAERSGARVVKHVVNKGYGAAIKTLFLTAKESHADVMVTLDSDGQHDASQISSLIEPILKNNYDIVIGSRFLTFEDRQKVPLYRSIGIKTITKLIQTVSYGNITDAQSGFRAYSSKALASIELVERGMAVSTEILIRAKDKNLSITEVPITIRYDVEDASTHNPVSHGIKVISSIIKYISLRHPLAFYGITGVALLLIAGFFGTNALYLFSTSNYVSTNLIIISAGLAIIGVVLLVTGIILHTIVILQIESRLNERPRKSQLS